MHGRPVENPRQSIRLFAMCESMKWNHLPIAGGLYDQHPQLLEEFELIFAAKARREKKEQDEQKRKAEHQRRSGTSRGARARRR